MSKQWGPLSGFTHTGYLQVARRYTGAQLKPNYPETEIIQGLRFAGLVGSLATIELAGLANNQALALEALERAKQYPSITP